jgi:hypothetical protein
VTPPRTSGIAEVVCASTTVCEAVGSFGTTAGTAYAPIPYVLGTSNGGSTWTEQTLPSGTSYIGGIACPSVAVCEADGGFSYGGSQSNALIGTADDGSTWTTQSLPSGTNESGQIVCPSAVVCKLLGQSSSGAVAVSTTNGGTTWTTQTMPSGTGNPSGIVCASTAVCEVLAVNGSDVPVTLGTTNGGATWTTQSVPSGTSNVSALSCPSTSSCFAAGGGTWPTGVEILSLSTTTTPPPTTSVLIPSNDATLSGTTTLDANATNATSVEFVLFGGSYGLSGHVVGTASPTAYGWVDSWNTTTVPNGSYALLSEALGSGGNTFSSGISITVHN